jgi:hypothetical protein
MMPASAVSLARRRAMRLASCIRRCLTSPVSRCLGAIAGTPPCRCRAVPNDTHVNAVRMSSAAIVVMDALSARCMPEWIPTTVRRCISSRSATDAAAAVSE